ncbi:uncharacterized protein VICG_00118 [Vittaforma corneae ATCC 50505]|uniref:MIP18 family-like domain-containing protein n=1 Tax=Vittaforma corneae (strain ATCC 50505) TaxID=993615 RepID=L2GPI5_VITCO|nr:uncharacterized protein VICG_00118 [Vittaforma corneae ATCC 50505]ELA42803.1 hypothetical protein VICG_00118 [Vittaforma corneae ATCC 50505]
MENANPFVNEKTLPSHEIHLVDGKLAEITQKSIFEILRRIRDPEHPYNLEQLNIISLEDIGISELQDRTVLCSGGQPIKSIEVVFTPTVPHCSMAGIIGLSIIYQLLNFTQNHHIIVRIKENTHSTYQALNKQLSDKDRVLAAFENEGLVDVIESCIEGAMQFSGRSCEN